jgi:hypothetical protein
MQIQRCNQCLLNHHYPGINFDENGTCCYCNGRKTYGASHSQEILGRLLKRSELAAEFQNAIRSCRGEGDYDCIIPLSGGKDSAYLASLLTEQSSLRLLCVTVDTGLLSETAVANVKHIVQALDLDHLQLSPAASLYRDLYRHYLACSPGPDESSHERGCVGTVCHFCHRVMFGQILKEAMIRKIPLVLAGYSPEQIEHYYYEVPREAISGAPWFPGASFMRAYGDCYAYYFWNPAVYPSGVVFPRFLFPFHVTDYPGESEVIRLVTEQGVIEVGQADPTVTNCHLNSLMMYLDTKRMGYNPYAPDLSYNIRHGKCDREKWLEFLDWCEGDPRVLQRLPSFEVAIGYLGMTLQDIERLLSARNATLPEILRTGDKS